MNKLKKKVILLQSSGTEDIERQQKYQWFVLNDEKINTLNFNKFFFITRRLVEAQARLTIMI